MHRGVRHQKVAVPLWLFGLLALQQLLVRRTIRRRRLLRHHLWRSFPSVVGPWLLPMLLLLSLHPFLFLFLFLLRFRLLLESRLALLFGRVLEGTAVVAR